jgi:hypothetical protein
MSDETAIQASFEEALNKLIEYRRMHGGIMLPTVVIAENAFNRALIAVGLRESKAQTYMFGKNQSIGD